MSFLISNLIRPTAQSDPETNTNVVYQTKLQLEPPSQLKCEKRDDPRSH